MDLNAGGGCGFKGITIYVISICTKNRHFRLDSAPDGIGCPERDFEDIGTALRQAQMQGVGYF
jgi:hypothetical protein